MKVLVDTCIWSIVLRHKLTKPPSEANILAELVADFRVSIIGPIRQELLSGIKEKQQFTLLKNQLSAFPDVVLSQNDFELASEYFNTCRKKGVQGSNTDFLICAASSNHDFSIYTNDKDFNHFAKYLPISLYEK